MAEKEYIDREALLDDLDAAMKNSGMGYVVGQTMKRYVKRVPAADVVPRAEYERLQAEKDALIKTYAECQKAYAREIFAEIERIVKQCTVTEYSKETGEYVRRAYNGHAIVFRLAELKKKYTEGE